MKRVKPIRISNESTIFIEINDESLPMSTDDVANEYLPQGAELVTAGKKIKDTMTMLKDTINSTAISIHDALDSSKSSEYAVEINIGFKGKSTPIPVILSGESNASIKVTIKWSNAKGTER